MANHNHKSADFTGDVQHTRKLIGVESEVLEWRQLANFLGYISFTLDQSEIDINGHDWECPDHVTGQLIFVQITFLEVHQIPERRWDFSYPIHTR